MTMKANCRAEFNRMHYDT